MTMCRIWQKYAPTTLTEEHRRKLEKRVYFPISVCDADFQSALKDMKLNLEVVNESLYDLILQAQPFSTKRPDMWQLRELGNLGKHVRLAKQTRQSRAASRATMSDGSMIVVAPPIESDVSQRVRDVRERMGDKVDPSTVENVEWVQFSVDEGPDVDPVIFCLSLSTSIEPYLSRLLAHV
jgi:hypothetical protein